MKPLRAAPTIAAPLAETAPQGLPERIQALAETVVQGTEVFVVGVDVRGHQGSRSVQVFFDSETGLGVDQCAALSRELGFLLDTEEVVKGRYRLNVSSPGADQPLVDIRQYRKHLGRPLQVAVQQGDTVVIRKGTLTEITEATLSLDDDLAQPIAFVDIETAHVQLPW